MQLEGRVTLQSNDNAAEGVLYMAMELGDKRWKLVFSDGGAKRRHETVEAGRRTQLVEAIGKAKANFHLPPEARVVSCYEAGRDGFWLHRYLVSLGIENQVVDSSSIETNRRERRVKTDRLDGVKLLTMLMRYWAGERGLWSVVRVPNVEEEDARRLHREARISEEGAHPASQSDPRLVSGAGPAPGASSRLSPASRDADSVGRHVPAPPSSKES